MRLSRSLVERTSWSRGDNQQGSILRRSLACPARSLSAPPTFSLHLGTAAQQAKTDLTRFDCVSI
jgi:hypothetical protein